MIPPKQALVILTCNQCQKQLKVQGTAKDALHMLGFDGWGMMQFDRDYGGSVCFKLVCPECRPELVKQKDYLCTQHRDRTPLDFFKHYVKAVT